LLASAHGYLVFAQDGRRIGMLIELVESDEPGDERVAIRCDGVIFWRRRLVPLLAVAEVDPSRRAIVLSLEKNALRDADEAQVDSTLEGWVGRRIAGYTTASEVAAETGSTEPPTPAERSSLEGAELAPPPAQQAPEEATAGEGHLLFVPTTAGYLLVERNGPAPPDGDRVELPEQAASFRVAKLGASPLPHDPRVCAYLDPLQ